jgi:uncharacterized membrane protein YjgN (DUF898 family)
MDETLQPAAPEPLRFSGKGSEYFGIWIVNLLLTLVTLGIYSAWAKVRRLQYFYRHTTLAGSGFDYHGDPLRILVGRLLAFGMLIAYQLSVRLHSPLTLVILVALALAVPWLLRNSFRFRLYNTSWRGMRFHFRGSVASAYRVFLLNGFLTIITLYLLVPFTHQRIKAYQHDNSWFGRTAFSFHARASQFYVVYLLLFGAVILYVVAVGAAGVFGDFIRVAGAQRQGQPVDTHAMIHAFALLYGIGIALALLIGPLFQALITNLVWNNTRLGEHRIECRLSPWKLLWVGISNLGLVILTLGVYIPWATVRVAKLHAEAVRLLPASDLSEFVADDAEDVGALGTEAATAFDFDISL